MGAGLTEITIATNPSYPEFFEGVVDEVFIFDRVLTLEEIDLVREFGAGLFVDDFERGDASRWTLTVP